jgi:ADP-ribosylglycohydrolase
MAPIGMYMKSKNIYEEGLEYARLVGRITHLDPRSVVSGVVQAHAIYSLLNEIPRDDFIPSVLEVCKKYEEPLTSKFSLYEKGNLTEKIEWVDKNKDASVSEALEKLMNDSLVFRCYPFALFMFQKYWGDPINGMLDLVNTGGDCDTTGAIYGSLVGARDGMIFPESWTGVLQDREEIIKMADGLYDLR